MKKPDGCHSNTSSCHRDKDTRLHTVVQGSSCNDPRFHNTNTGIRDHCRWTALPSEQLPVPGDGSRASRTRRGGRRVVYQKQFTGCSLNQRRIYQIGMTSPWIPPFEIPYFRRSVCRCCCQKNSALEKYLGSCYTACRVVVSRSAHPLYKD